MKRYEKIARNTVVATSIILPLLGLSTIAVFGFACALMINY